MKVSAPLVKSLLIAFLALSTPLTRVAAQPAACGAEIQTAEVNGTTLHYFECGEGEPVLFVHGTLGDYRTWAGQAQPFSEQYRVISYSRRYHYPNPWPQDASRFSVSVHAKDLAAFIRALNLDSVHLIGHSYGAFTALLAARNHPDLVRTLTLGEPPVMSLAVQTPQGDSLFQSFMEHSILPAHEAFESGHIEEGVRQFVNGVLGEREYEKMPPNAHFNMLENARELNGETAGMAARGRAFFPTVTCEEAGNINIPALIIDGERSPTLLSLANDALAQCLPNHDRVMIPAASHGLKIQEPPVFTNKVLPFLAAH